MRRPLRQAPRACGARRGRVLDIRGRGRLRGETMAGDRADISFAGGVVHTVEAQTSIAEAVAVSDGRILAVGSDADVQATAGPSTRHIELRGRSLTPGFIDAHAHFTGVGGAQHAID